jgi:predicted dehydrogenase
MSVVAAVDRHHAQPGRRLRLGFLGVGWIGRHRMECILGTGLAEAVVIADTAQACADAARDLAPDAAIVGSHGDLLEFDLDGVVIATPSALHAEQSIRALERGVAVFCQKPLGRNSGEVRAVVEAARRADRLLGVDLSYRHAEGMRRVHNLIRSGELGHVHAANLVFHNAYGPDKPWFYDRRLSGGGCVMDLGVHLVDLALWTLDYPEVRTVSSSLYNGGRPLERGTDEVEDFAAALIELSGGTTLQLSCSWKLPVGQEALISATFYGTDGGAEFSNVAGSFYDFRARHFTGTSSQVIAEPPDAWGGRAAAAWVDRLAAGQGFDAEAERFVDLAGALDAIMG